MLLPMWVRRPPNTTATENGWVNEHGIVVYPIKGLVSKIAALRDELDFYGLGLFDCLETVEEEELVKEPEPEAQPEPQPEPTTEPEPELEQAEKPEQPQRKKPGPKPKNKAK